MFNVFFRLLDPRKNNKNGDHKEMKIDRKIIKNVMVSWQKLVEDNFKSAKFITELEGFNFDIDFMAVDPDPQIGEGQQEILLIGRGPTTPLEQSIEKNTVQSWTPGAGSAEEGSTWISLN